LVPAATFSGFITISFPLLCCRRSISREHSVFHREPSSALGKRIASAVADVLAEASKDVESSRSKQHRFWKKSDEPTQQFDFVVIGSGVAGLKYALSVAEHGSVAVVTKSAARESNTNYAQVRESVCSIERPSRRAALLAFV
jgi:heterodisulfide reductase subunit A-like polyferredoxin